MEFIIRFVTESPESIAYNFILILCIQVSFGLAFWLWQRSPGEDLAWRMMVSSVVLFLIRIGWFILLNIYSEDRFFMAPIERGLNFVSIVYFVWALAPVWPEVRGLRVIGLFLAMLGTAAALPYAIQNWTVLQVGLPYGETNQAPVWALLQIVFCLSCIFSLIIHRPYDWPLRFLAVIPILGGSLLHLFNVSPADIGFNLGDLQVDERLAGGIIPIWDRLALLISLPIFTAVVYRRNSSYMLRRTTLIAGSPEHLHRFVTRLDQLLATEHAGDRNKYIAGLVNELFDPQFVGVAPIEEAGRPYVDVNIFQKNEARFAFEERRIWMMNTNDWPAVVDAINRGQAVQLTPAGQAARQLYEMHQEFHLRLVTPILIVPLITDASYEGVLFIGAPPQQTVWAQDSIDLMTPLSQLLAQAFQTSRQLATAGYGHALPAASDLSIIDELAFDAKIDELKEQKSKVEARLFQMASRLTETERSLRVAEQQLQESREQDDGKAQQMQAELNSLKSSIQELGSTNMIPPVPNGTGTGTGPSDLDTAWVAQAISQYSNALEESQQQISQLENRLRTFHRGRFRDSISRLGTEARSPLTSIQAYTDLLLQDTTGFLTVKQIDLLQRVKSSAAIIYDYLESLDQSFMLDELAAVSGLATEFSPVLDLAIDLYKEDFRAKRIEIELDITDEMPPLLIDRNTLYQIINELLYNVLDLIPEGGNFRLVAYCVDTELTNEPGRVKIAHLMVTDLALSESDQHKIMDNLTASRAQMDTLSMDEASIGKMYQLVKSVGGRVWFQADGVSSTGQTLILLLPVSHSPYEEEINELNGAT